MKATTEITNDQDILDSRDIIARIEDLRGTLDALKADLTDALERGETDGIEEAREALADWLGYADDPSELDTLDLSSGNLADWVDNAGQFKSSDESRELAALEALAAEAEGYGDWVHGETLIRETYFREYAEQLADDIGAVDRDARWPRNHIDWGAAADELRQDYTEVDFDGVPYLMRC